jgi:hypothetical protein
MQPWLRWLGAAVAVVLVVLIAWSPARLAPYHYDDTLTPGNDPASQSLMAFRTHATTTLRPLTKLTFALESSAGFRDAPHRRILQVVMLVGCALCLLVLLRRASVPLVLATGAAGLWAVHPANAELVIALAGRSVLLSLLLILVSAVAVTAQQPRTAMMFAVLGVLARETSVLWLLGCSMLVGIQCGWPRRRLLTALVIIGATATTYVCSSLRLRTLVVDSFSDPWLGDRLGRQWAAIGAGLWRWVWAPFSFTLDMDFAPLGAARAGWIVTSIVLVVAAIVVAVRRTTTEPIRVAAMLWLSLLLPTQSIIPKYDPLTARPIASAAVAVVLAVIVVIARRGQPRHHIVAAIAVLACMTAIVPITRSRAALYMDAVALWQDAVQHTTHTTRPLKNLATVLAARGRYDEAKAALLAALRRDPHDVDARLRLAAVDVLQNTAPLLVEPPEGDMIPQ